MTFADIPIICRISYFHTDMIRTLLFLVSIYSCFTSAFAQTDYYNNIDPDLRCQALKDALQTLISNDYVARDYDATLNFMKENDKYLGTDGKNYIWDMYSDVPGETPPYRYLVNEACGTDASATAEGICWNREHSMPASWFANATPTYTDIVNLVPTDGYVNNRRSNNPIAKIAAASWTSGNGSKVGSSAVTGVSGTVFEPIDSYKGDFARIMLYMIVRYADNVSSWTNSDARRVLGTDPLMGYKKEYLDMLIEWHEQDPPSEKEILRNARIQVFQKNRNPFVDRPEYVSYIWKTEDCKAVGVKDYEKLSVQLYPNPSGNGYIYVQNALVKGQYYSISDISGRILVSSRLNTAEIDVRGLSNGTYFLFLEEDTKTGYSKFVIAQ